MRTLNPVNHHSLPPANIHAAFNYNFMFCTFLRSANIGDRASVWDIFRYMKPTTLGLNDDQSKMWLHGQYGLISRFVVLRVILRQTSTRLRAETGKEVKSEVNVKINSKKTFTKWSQKWSSEIKKFGEMYFSRSEVNLAKRWLKLLFRSVEKVNPEKRIGKNCFQVRNLEKWSQKKRSFCFYRS